MKVKQFLNHIDYWISRLYLTNDILWMIFYEYLNKLFRNGPMKVNLDMTNYSKLTMTEKNEMSLKINYFKK